MNLTQAINIINSVYIGIDGHAISYEAKRKLNYTDKTLVYGEILLDSFFEILKEVKPKDGEIFYDLGCGVGKPVFAASFLFPFSKSIGIELLQDVYQGALKVKENFEKNYPKEQINNKKILFINGDIFKTDFFDGDVIFIHATCLPNQLMEALSKKLENLKKGSRVIVATRSIYSDKFNLQKSITYKMGWGESLVNFYEKIE